MSDELTPEDRALLAAVAALQPETGAPPSPTGPGLSPSPPPSSGSGSPPPPPEATAEAETLTRLYQEALGLLPFALDPVPPRPEARLRLLGLLVASAPPDASPVAAVASGSASGPPEARRDSGPAKRPPMGASVPAAVASRSRAASVAASPRWPLALAAALVLALLGTSGWLYRDLLAKRSAIATLESQRDVALQHAGEAEGRLRRLRTQVTSLRDSFSVVTSPAVEVCSLRAVTADAAAASGMLFVAADHQHWMMSLRGLRPPGGGKVYQLWFEADQGVVSGGTFTAALGAPVELGSETMPAGTRGVRITLEPSPGSTAPGGPDLLRNASALHSLG